MPIYEYECRACRHRFEQLIIHSTTAECPSCQGAISSVSFHCLAWIQTPRGASALKDAKRRQAQTTRDHNDAEICVSPQASRPLEQPFTASLRHYFVGVAPLMTVSGSTSVDTPARTMISRSASAVGTWNRKFMPR